VPVLAPQPHSRCSLLVEQVSLAECTAAGASSTHGPRSVVGTLVGRGRSTRANYSSVTDDAHLWEATLGFLRSLHHLPGALATAALLKSVRNDWEDRVIARTSMHDLLLTLPNQGFPWEADVRVSARGGDFEFTLHGKEGVVATDHRGAADGASVLRSFLEQLIAEG
jgi:hypothetical protein